MDFLSVNIASGDQLVTLAEDVTVTLRYPLGTPYVVKSHNRLGFTLQEFTEVIRKGYEAAYAEPDKYEPWGHSIGELYLEDIEEVSPGVFEISVGS